MRILSDYINFGNKIINKKENGIYYTNEYNDSDVLIKHSEYDLTNDRFIRQDTYNNEGDLIEKWWFEYYRDRQVENLDSPTQKYVRTIKNEIIDGLSVKTEEFVSKTNPDKNYVNKIVRDYTGKMLKFISNGVDLMKHA